MQGLVTVFGGSGFVGLHVVRALAKDGWRIRVAARNPNLAPQLRVMGAVGQIELVACNVTDPESVDRVLVGAQAVVNLVSVLQSGGRQTFKALNAEAPGRIAQAAATRGIASFVQMSALGADASSPSEYARTKARGEAAVRAALPGAVVLRPSVVFGPEDAFFNRFAAMAAVVPALPLIGGGETRFSPVYVGDVGAAVAHALKGAEATGRTFELVGPNTHTFRELMQIMSRGIQRSPLLIPLPFPIASLMGAAGDVAAFFGLPAPITRDQVELLKSDNVASPGARGLAELGIEATTLDSVLPTYLWRFRSGGQFAEPSGDGHGTGRQAGDARSNG